MLIIFLASGFLRSLPRATQSMSMMASRARRAAVRLIESANVEVPAMPHFTIEYSANLDACVDMAKVVEVVRKAAVETGIFPLGGIRVRAVRCEHYAIGNGNPEFAFLDMLLRLGEGRDLQTRQKAGEHIFRALSAYLDPVFAKSKFALSFDMQINDKETSWKRNNIHEALKAEAAHG
jgi:5-carboxymethyl-2-hydroxymuconate isomerase